MKKQANEIVNEKVDAVSNAIANAVKVESSNELYPLENDLMFTTVMKNKDACIGLLGRFLQSSLHESWLCLSG